MKKKLFGLSVYGFISCILLLTTSCETHNDRLTNGFNGGKVKSCITTAYIPIEKFGQWESDEIAEYGHEKVTFTENGDYTTIDILKNKDELIWRIIPKREKGKIIEEIYYEEDGSPGNRSVVNNSSKKIIEWEMFNNNNEKISTGKTFLKNGRNIKVVSISLEDENPNESTNIWEYDNNNNSLFKVYQNEELVFTERYEYIESDVHRNWTKRLIYQNDETTPYKIQIRKIEYY